MLNSIITDTSEFAATSIFVLGIVLLLALSLKRARAKDQPSSDFKQDE